MRSRAFPWFQQLAYAQCVGIIAGLVFFSLPSFAQDEPEEFEEDETLLEEVIVTGSRIKRRDFTSPSPLVTISREDFEFSGQPTIEEYLNQMPQLMPDFGRTANNPGDGTARLNLRGMGAGRTLVLLNGRRLAPSGVGSAVDVNYLFDKQPPQMANNVVSNNTDTRLFDVFGRTFYLSISLRL